MSYDEIEESEGILLEILKKVKGVETLEQRLFTRKIISIIDDSDGVVEDHMESLEDTKQILSDIDLQRLLTLAAHIPLLDQYPEDHLDRNKKKLYKESAYRFSYTLTRLGFRRYLFASIYRE